MQYRSRIGVQRCLHGLVAAMSFALSAPAPNANTLATAQRNTHTAPSVSQREPPSGNKPGDVKAKDSQPKQSTKRGSSLEP